MGLINALWKGGSVKQDSSNRLVTDTEKAVWNNKADKNHAHTIANVTGLQDALNNTFLPDFNIPRQKPINLETVGITMKNVQEYIGTDKCPHVGDYWLTSTPSTQISDGPKPSDYDYSISGFIVGGVNVMSNSSQGIKDPNTETDIGDLNNINTLLVLPMKYYPNIRGGKKVIETSIKASGSIFENIKKTWYLDTDLKDLLQDLWNETKDYFNNDYIVTLDVNHNLKIMPMRVLEVNGHSWYDADKKYDTESEMIDGYNYVIGQIPIFRYGYRLYGRTILIRSQYEVSSEYNFLVMDNGGVRVNNTIYEWMTYDIPYYFCITDKVYSYYSTSPS